MGKTGLALRLCENRWEATESTHGMNVFRLELPPNAEVARVERKVWLWDFAGQPDYRLLHQLYMDETALGVIVFDPQDDNPFGQIGYWEKALGSTTKHEPARLLVAARCDRGGIIISRKRFERYIQEHGFAGFLVRMPRLATVARNSRQPFSSILSKTNARCRNWPSSWTRKDIPK